MSQQIQISGGAKVRDLQDVIIGTSGVLSSLAFNVANGVPKLDVNGKILVSQLPNSVMEYKGVWNAATNSPTLTNGGAFNQGDVYLCDTAGTVNFGSGSPISFIVGDQAIYSGSVWQKAGGATGTVTSVGLSTNGGAITIGSSPITTSGTITANFNGTNLQYVNGAGNLTTFPTLITSIGLTMPSAFSVANSPLTANGTIAVTGAGVASQYIRGDGTLADFPSSGGGGSSVSYYLNGGTSQGTIGGVTYYEMSKTADTGTMADFTKTGDGFIVAFLTDANDPAQLNIPAGNWNYEIYASMSANGGTPEMYAELYKYDGTTFTLIATSPHEILYDGTALNLYTFAMTVPATSLTLTDRLAIKLYATNSGGKTTTIHTQDSHLCQIITTFSTGITALNGLTAQVQYFQTGTSGTDFNISSTTATHTFNIPDASATARGLITTGTQTIAGTKTFTDATKNNGGIFLQNASSSSLAGYMNIGGLTNGVKFTSGGGVSNTFTLPSATGYTFTFPNATGTIALTSDISYPVTSVFGRTGAVVATSGDYNTDQVTEGTTNLYFTDYRARTAISATGPLVWAVSVGTMSIDKADGFLSGYISATDWNTFNNKQAALSGTGFVKISGTTISYDNSTYYLASNPSAFIALTALSAGVGISYNNTTGVITNSAPDQVVALTASTGISVTGTYPNFTITNTSPSSGGTVTSVAALTIGTTGTDVSSTVANSTTTPVITLNIPSASATNRGLVTTGTQTFAGSKTFSSDLVVNGLKVGTGVMNIATNTAIGVSVLNAGTGSGDYNVGVGYNAMLVNINGAESVAVGAFSLKTNTNGGLNTAIGAYSLYLNTSGYYNTAVGHSALYYNTTGERNTAVGISALTAVTTGTYNIGIGESAGASITTGSKNTIVGRYLGTTTLANNVVLADGDGNVRFQWDGTNVLLNGNTAITQSGTITTNYLPKFTGTSTIGNSIISESSGIISIAGRLSATGSDYHSLVVADGSAQLRLERTTSSAGVMYLGADNVGFKIFDSAFATRLTLTSDGNLGLGVTPSAWYSTMKSITVKGSNGNGSSWYSGGSQDLVFFANGYYDAAATPTRNSTGGTAQYRMTDAQHSWWTDATTTGAISLTQAMTLTAAGRLLINTPTESTYQLDVNGTGRFNSSVTATAGIFNLNTTDGGFKVTAVAATPSNLAYLANNYFAKFYTRPDQNYGITIFDQNEATAIQSADLVNGTNAKALIFNPYGGNVGIGTSSPQLNTNAGTFTTIYNASASGWLELATGSTADGLGGSITFNNNNIVGTDKRNAQISGIRDGANNSAALIFITWNAGSAAERMRITKEGVLQVANASGTLGTIVASERLNVNGDVYAYGKYTGTSFFESSDSRLKTLIQDNYQTKGIASITPKLYTKNGKVELGYYAQDFVGILDSAVSKGSDDMLSLSYREVLVAKVYALEQEIKDLKAKMN